jgi:RHS repeat-associated protein
MDKLPCANAFGAYRTKPDHTANPTLTDRGFTGHRMNNTGLDDLGLIYMNARYYLPEVGRFISPDTIVPDPGNPQSFNRYAYVLNSPTNFVDPSGHAVCRPGEGLCRNPVDFEPISFDTGNNTGNATVSLMVNLGCGLTGGWCKAENNTISPTSDSEWMANQDPAALVNPIAMAGGVPVRELAKAVSKSGPEAAAAVKALAKAGTQGELVENAIVSLGHSRSTLGLPGFIDWARSNGAVYLKLPDDIFASLMRTGNWWSVNKQFLDDAISVNAQFHLQVPKAQWQGWFAAEIEYLLSRGYELVSEGSEYWLRRLGD